jgi:NitT/TauT family transport system ATP-binding protein
MTADTLIQAKDITKVYETKDGLVESLKPLSFSIQSGEFVSVVGPSGCGKSTLLKMVAGLLPITSGELKIEGKPVDGPQKDVGIVFQSAVLLAWRTVIENIMLQAEMRNMPKEEATAKAMQLIDMAGLKGFEGKYPRQLSGGMQQRASICRALLHDPPLLLMDEPFGALDAMTREKMNLELQRIWLASKKTVLLITHSIPEAIFLSDRVIIMSERPGTIAAVYDINLPRTRHLDMMGTPEFANYAKQIRAHFFSQGTLDH